MHLPGIPLLVQIGFCAGASYATSSCAEVGVNILGAVAYDVIRKMGRTMGWFEPERDPGGHLRAALAAAIVSASKDKTLESLVRDATGSLTALEVPDHFEVEDYLKKLPRDPFIAIRGGASDLDLMKFLESPGSDTFRKISSLLDWHWLNAADGQVLTPEVSENLSLAIFSQIALRFKDEVEKSPEAWRAYSGMIHQELRGSLGEMKETLHAIRQEGGQLSRQMLEIRKILSGLDRDPESFCREAEARVTDATALEGELAKAAGKIAEDNRAQFAASNAKLQEIFLAIRQLQATLDRVDRKITPIGKSMRPAFVAVLVLLCVIAGLVIHSNRMSDKRAEEQKAIMERGVSMMVERQGWGNSQRDRAGASEEVWGMLAKEFELPVEELKKIAASAKRNRDAAISAPAYFLDGNPQQALDTVLRAEAENSDAIENSLQLMWLKARSYAELRKYDEARDAYRSVASLINRQSRPLDWAMAKREEAGVEWDAMNYEASVKAGREAELALRETSGADTPPLAETLVSLGRSLVMTGQVQEAETLFKEALVTNRRMDSPRYPVLVFNLRCLGLCQVLKNALGEAEQSLSEALKVAKEGNPAASVDEGLASAELAWVLALQGRQEESDKLVERAVRIEADHCKEKHLHIGDQLAVAFFSHMAGQQAVPLARIALRIAEGKFGPASSITIFPRRQLSDLLVVNLRHDEAIRLTLENVRIWKNEPETREPALSRCLDHFIRALELLTGESPWDTAQICQALDEALEAARGDSKTLESVERELLSLKAHLLIQSGDTDQAKKLLARVEALTVGRPLGDHLLMAANYIRMARVFLAEDAFDEAVQSAHKAIELYKVRVSPSCPILGLIYNIIATAEAKRRNLAEAARWAGMAIGNIYMAGNLSGISEEDRREVVENFQGIFAELGKTPEEIRLELEKLGMPPAR